MNFFMTYAKSYVKGKVEAVDPIVLTTCLYLGSFLSIYTHSCFRQFIRLPADTVSIVASPLFWGRKNPTGVPFLWGQQGEGCDRGLINPVQSPSRYRWEATRKTRLMGN